MTQPTPNPAKRGWWVGPLVLVVILGLIAFALRDSGPYMARALGEARLHAPDLSLLADEPIQLQLHIAAALVALVIGIVIMVLPKGVGPHKALGWTWVAAMATTAASSLFITGLNGNSYSLIHLISGWTIIALPMAVFAIRTNKVAMHRRTMTGLFVGGLLIAGGLTFLPGRLMFQVFFN